MPMPRYTQVSLDDTPYYHCVSRCVRRAFLCGGDPVSGKSYEHRRGWVEERLLQLTHCFSIDLCAYAVMSNHTHVVLHVDAKRAESWPLATVVDHWHGLYAGSPLSRRFLAGESLSPAEMHKLEEQAALWRERLVSISWFMRCLNEPIARQANAEDGCSGRFWEGRFKCQALLDEAALAACLAYVDLNPIRADMAKTPETSAFTSIFRRIRRLNEGNASSQPEQLMPFVGNPREPVPKGLPFELNDYLQLVDWTGRIIRPDKCSHIDQATPPILKRLGISRAAWESLTSQFETQFCHCAGRPDSLGRAAASRGLRWLRGTGNARALFQIQ